MSEVGPWQRLGSGSSGRLDESGAIAAIVRPPGGPEDRWGWFAMNPKGNSRGGKIDTEEQAKRLADEALIEMGDSPKSDSRR